MSNLQKKKNRIPMSRLSLLCLVCVLSGLIAFAFPQQAQQGQQALDHGKTAMAEDFRPVLPGVALRRLVDGHEDVVDVVGPVPEHAAMDRVAPCRGRVETSRDER